MVEPQSRKSLASLSPEIIDHIFSLLPNSALHNLRCTNRQLSLVATSRIFRSLRLRAYGDSPQRLLHIADSDRVRGFVRELTCDTWLGPENCSCVFEIPDDFIDAMGLLSSFYGLRALHLRFSQACGRGSASAWTKIEETNEFRSEVLYTIFECLEGATFPRAKDFNQSGELISQRDPAIPISLSTLTISNLGDNYDPYVMESDTFKAFLASGIVDLRLHITTRLTKYGRWRPFKYYDKHELFNQMPKTWLALPLATNLRVLSLYCYEYWGWHPKMDFRAAGGGRGFPNLKVLALGKYVFSHEWQAEWFVSLGIQEFYLDDCRIVYQSRTWWTPDDGITVAGQDDEGRDILLSDDGYLRIDDVFEEMHGINPEREPDDSDESDLSESDVPLVMIPFPLRWHTLLSRWRESMPNLIDFKIGSGTWDGPAQNDPIASFLDPDSESAAEKAARLRPKDLKYNGFRNFSCPPPSDEDEDDEDQVPAGLCQDGEKQLSYVYHDMSNWWEWEDWNDPLRDEGDRREWVFEKDLRATDEAALELLLATVRERRGKLHVSNI